MALITKTLVPSPYDVCEMLTCGNHGNFPGMFKIPFVSPVRKMDASSERQGFRGVLETFWLDWKAGHGALWVTAEQDESGTRHFPPLGLFPGLTGERRDQEAPVTRALWRTLGTHNKDV